jgi:hypothetical protein
MTMPGGGVNPAMNAVRDYFLTAPSGRTVLP